MLGAGDEPACSPPQCPGHDRWKKKNTRRAKQNGPKTALAQGNWRLEAGSPRRPRYGGPPAIRETPEMFEAFPTSNTRDDCRPGLVVIYWLIYWLIYSHCYSVDHLIYQRPRPLSRAAASCSGHPRRPQGARAPARERRRHRDALRATLAIVHFTIKAQSVARTLTISTSDSDAEESDDDILGAGATYDAADMRQQQDIAADAIDDMQDLNEQESSKAHVCLA
eukprot:COSAG03_NODE_384_length_8325_cov_50.332726_5_plen_223_part_00